MGFFDDIPAFLRRKPGLKQVKAPAPPALSGPMRDSNFANYAKGLGTASDVGQQSVTRREPTLDIDDVAVLMRRGLYARLVRMLSMWTWAKMSYTLSGFTPEEVEIIRRRMEELNFWSIAMDADAKGMGYGACPVHVVVSSREGGAKEDPTETPLNPAKVKRIFALHPLNPRGLEVKEIYTRRENPRYLQPAKFGVTPRPVGGYTVPPYTLDVTRTLGFYGIPNDDVDYSPQFTGLWPGSPRPWADQIFHALRSVGTLYTGADRLSLEAVIHLFTLDDDEVSLGADLARGTPFVDRGDRIRDIVTAMGFGRGVFLNSGEDLKAVTANLTGFEALVLAAFQRVALEADVPLILLLGQAPPGLSTDDKSWWTQWEKRILNRRAERAVPIMRQMITMIMAEQGIEVDDWRIELGPLRELTDLEIAELRLKHTQADRMLLDAFVLSPEEVRQRESGGAYETHLTLEDGDVPKVKPIPDEEADAALTDALAWAASRRDARYSPEFRRRRFKIPAGAAGNARKVLAWKKKHGAEVKGMTSTGWARARQLANEETVSGDDLIEIAAWFARHGAQGATKSVSEKHKDEPWKDNGWVSWLGWGGDTAESWATEIVENEAKR